MLADNEGKMDMKQYGPKIDEYIEAKGERVQKVSYKAEELVDNYIIERDGVISLFPKAAGQVSPLFLFAIIHACVIISMFSIQPPADVNIINYPIPPPESAAEPPQQ